MSIRRYLAVACLGLFVAGCATSAHDQFRTLPQPDQSRFNGCFFSKEAQKMKMAKACADAPKGDRRTQCLNQLYLTYVGLPDSAARTQWLTSDNCVVRN